MDADTYVHECPGCIKGTYVAINTLARLNKGRKPMNRGGLTQVAAEKAFARPPSLNKAILHAFSRVVRALLEG